MVLRVEEVVKKFILLQRFLVRKICFYTGKSQEVLRLTLCGHPV